MIDPSVQCSTDQVSGSLDSARLYHFYHQGVRQVVWGDEQYNYLHNTSLHDKQDIIARVCARLSPPQKTTDEVDSYEV